MPFDLQKNLDAILTSPSYPLAENDTAFLQRPELRPVRLQLELLKPEMALEEHKVLSTIVVFGGTQIVEPAVANERLAAARQAAAADPKNKLFARALARKPRPASPRSRLTTIAAREFSRIVSSACQIGGLCDYVMLTGGGPGIMEAANRGAFDVGAKSIGLNIHLPAEQAPNPASITPELLFSVPRITAHAKDALRSLRAAPLVAFPGGFGTLDELFEVLTLRQTGRMQDIPVILFGKALLEPGRQFSIPGG